MFKSTTTKIFISFAAVVVLQTIVLSWMYARVMLRESENFALESLSKRSENQAHEISLKLKQNYPVDHLQIEGYRYVTDQGDAFNLSTPFSSRELRTLLPLSGSQVSVCSNTKGEPYYCSLSAVTGAKVWAIELAPRLTIVAVFENLAKEISGILLIALVLALLITFFISKILLRPLRQFTLAAQSIAKGDFQELTLPTHRLDEIGGLAMAFDKMKLEIREREKNIAISSLKLAHSSRLASIGEMGASIAHEIKNPLTSMIGYAKILASKISDPSLQEAAQVIHNEGERCNQILQQMLRFARSDPTEKRPYSILEVIQSTLLLLKSEAKSRQITLHSEQCSDCILVGSPQPIQQVIINLLMNAIQASPTGSKIELLTHQTDDAIELSVVDHGSGIPKSVQHKIFDPFFTTKGSVEGTGLGLSVAREIIQDQGGSIRFESEEGKGTRFTIHLPRPIEQGAKS